MTLIFEFFSFSLGSPIAESASFPLFPHDRLFRESLQNREVAVDFFKAHLPPAILAKLRLDTLQAIPESFVNAGLE